MDSTAAVTPENFNTAPSPEVAPKTPPVTVTVTAADGKFYGLKKNDLVAIGKGLLVAVAGAGLTYLTAVIARTDFSYTLGTTTINFTPVVYVVLSTLVNSARKYLDGE